MGPSDRRRHRALAALAAASVALGGLVACNQILGTDAFSNGDPLVPEGGSQDGSIADGNTDLDGSMTRDAGIDAYIQLPPGTQPATWAQWQMPDNLLDGGPTTSYTVQGSSVLDNVTQLVWQKTSASVPGANPGFSDAKAVCDAIGPDGGSTKWRVPTRIELVSLLAHIDDAGAPRSGAPGGTIDPIFTGAANTYWTSSPVLPAGTPLNFWFVDFKTGGLARDTTAPYVRCVKGGG